MKTLSLFVAILALCTIPSRSEAQNFTPIFNSFSGFAASGEISSVGGTMTIQHVIGEGFIARVATPTGDAVVHSGHLPPCLVPIATVGYAQADGGLRVKDSARTPAPIGPDDSVCQGEVITLRAIGGGAYLWSTGETTSTITVRADPDIPISVQTFLPGGTDAASACYASRPDIIVIPLHRLHAEICVGSLLKVDPRASTAIDARIPLTLLSHTNLDICRPETLTLSIRMNRKLFKPRSVDPPGSILSDVIAGNDRLVTINIPFPTGNLARGTTIAHLVGDVLLGNQDNTTLEIVPQPGGALAAWARQGEPYTVTTTTCNGQLTLDSLCRLVTRTRLLDWDPPSLTSIRPNPVGDQVTVTFSVPTDVASTIEIYSAIGGLMFRKSMEGVGSLIPDETVEQSVMIPTSGLTTGSYRIIIRTATGVQSASMVIAR